MTYSIIISSYNYGHLAAHAIESVLSQTKQFNKIWFVDDGAGDCRHLLKLYGKKVEFILREQNLGIVANFNDMLKRINTDYTMFLGADNWLRSDSLELLSSYSIDNKPDIIVYDIVITGELKDEIQRLYVPNTSKYQGDFLWNRKGGHHGSMLYKVKLAKDVGGYANNKSSRRTDEDLYLWNKMIQAGASTIHISEGLLYYRRHFENFNKY